MGSRVLEVWGSRAMWIKIFFFWCTIKCRFVSTNISGKLALCNIGAIQKETFNVLPWRWRRPTPPKPFCLHTSIHGVVYKFMKILTCIVICFGNHILFNFDSKFLVKQNVHLFVHVKVIFNVFKIVLQFWVPLNNIRKYFPWSYTTEAEKKYEVALSISCTLLVIPVL